MTLGMWYASLTVTSFIDTGRLGLKDLYQSLHLEWEVSS